MTAGEDDELFFLSMLVNHLDAEVAQQPPKPNVVYDQYMFEIPTINPEIVGDDECMIVAPPLKPPRITVDLTNEMADIEFIDQLPSTSSSRKRRRIVFIPCPEKMNQCKLSFEMALEICAYLTVEALMKMSRVCHLFNAVVKYHLKNSKIISINTFTPALFSQCLKMNTLNVAEIVHEEHYKIIAANHNTLKTLNFTKGPLAFSSATHEMDIKGFSMLTSLELSQRKSVVDDWGYKNLKNAMRNAINVEHLIMRWHPPLYDEFPMPKLKHLSLIRSKEWTSSIKLSKTLLNGLEKLEINYTNIPIAIYLLRSPEAPTGVRLVNESVFGECINLKELSLEYIAFDYFGKWIFPNLNKFKFRSSSLYPLSDAAVKLFVKSHLDHLIELDLPRVCFTIDEVMETGKTYPRLQKLSMTYFNNKPPVSHKVFSEIMTLGFPNLNALDLECIAIDSPPLPIVTNNKAKGKKKADAVMKPISCFSGFKYLTELHCEMEQDNPLHIDRVMEECNSLKILEWKINGGYRPNYVLAVRHLMLRVFSFTGPVEQVHIAHCPNMKEITLSQHEEKSSFKIVGRHTSVAFTGHCPMLTTMNLHFFMHKDCKNMFTSALQFAPKVQYFPREGKLKQFIQMIQYILKDQWILFTNLQREKYNADEFATTFLRLHYASPTLSMNIKDDKLFFAKLHSTTHAIPWTKHPMSIISTIDNVIKSILSPPPILFFGLSNIFFEASVLNAMQRNK
jgi:hypothetical protein